MPIYEYACKNCGHTLDELQKISDEPLVDCPECGQPELKRLLSAPRFRLKGAGWYETDFKTDNQRNLSKADGDSASAGSKGDTSESASGNKTNGAKPASDSGTAKSAEKGSDSKPHATKSSESKSSASKSE